jgi:membrane protein required for colicin V production
LLASVALGAWRGLVYEMVSALGWVAAFLLAQAFAELAGTHLPMAGAPASMRYAVGFVLVFVGVLFAAGLLAWAVKKLVEAIGLRPVDRTMGAAFGLLRGLVLLLAATVVMNLTPLGKIEAWQESRGAPLLTAALKGLQPVFDLMGMGQHLLDKGWLDGRAGSR